MTTKKLACPACEATLQVAATLPSGKKIRCPKCREVFAPRLEEEAPRKTSIQNGKRAAALADEEEAEERPAARKKSRKAAKKLAGPLPWLIGGGAVLLIAAVVTLAILFWPAKKNEPVADSGAPRHGPPGMPVSGTEPGNDNQQPVSPGRRVFNMNCARCHSTSPMGPGRAPNLAKVGTDPSHTVEWFTAFIRNPRAVKPNSRMQPFENRIQPNDLQQLAEYLTTLK